MEKELQTIMQSMNLSHPSDEPEPYILTPQEEENVLNHEKEQIKKHKAWRYAQMGLSEGEILLRLAQIQWEESLNKEEILQRANSNKHYKIWQDQQRQKDIDHENQKKEELQKKCNAKYIFNIMAWTSQNVYGKKLIVNDSNKHLIKTMCYFLSNDERFISELGYDFNKGLLIRGITGLGKTFIAKCVQDNEINPILILSVIEITEEIKQDGFYNIDLGKRKIIYLDDVGTEEPTVNHYGTKITFFKSFIENIYLRNSSFNKLMFSTNDNMEELKEKYGYRVRSRIDEMFNVVTIKGEDMRTI